VLNDECDTILYYYLHDRLFNHNVQPERTVKINSVKNCSNLIFSVQGQTETCCSYTDNPRFFGAKQLQAQLEGNNLSLRHCTRQ
jgi:hypothetical protein